MNNLPKLTPEQIEAAQKARAEKKAWCLENVRMEYADSKYWKELAQEYGIRMPQRHIHNTETKHLKRAIRALGVDQDEYLEACGVKTIKQLVALNPTFSAYAEVGLLLEFKKNATM